MKRLHETVTKIDTPFRGVFVHLSWDDRRLVGASLSHQGKDLKAPVADLIEQISNGLCEAIKAGP